MPTILDFQIQYLSAETYTLTVCERGFSHPLASTTYSHRVDFLTDFSVDRLNAPNSLIKDAAERFDELLKLGRELYQKLFPPTVEQVWREYKQRSEFLILCLRFAEGATKLEVLPWETLHDGEEFIAAGAKTTLTRLPMDVTPPSTLPPIPCPLKLFGFFSSPLDLQDHERLNSEREQEILLEAINDPAAQGRISADFEDEAKLGNLERSLREGYHILHFTGHGISPRDGGGLLLEDAHGKKLHASIAEVMQAIASGVDKLRLAVISGCQTARTLHTQGFNDLARELLRKRVPAVIAMQFSITDEGGLKFAEVLYREITKGVELERAVHMARRVLLEYRSDPPKPSDLSINNDALAIVLLAADGACLQTTEAKIALPLAEPGATYLGDRLDSLVYGFYGRRREYRKIRYALLHQGQRAVIIHGIGGIGKTALLTHAINRLRPHFKDVMSFDCRRAALAPETILLELSRYFVRLGKPQLQSLIGQNAPPETLAEEIAILLTEWPLLIVFDNFESQLDERHAFLNENLRVFLTTLVRATTTGSRFLFTTRYLFDLDGERLCNVQELPLGDLSRPEALMLMQKLPNLLQSSPTEKRAALEKFGGHPYALVLLDRHCSNQPLNQALQDASSLKSELHEYQAIELNYRRLSDRARELLNRLAAFRQFVPFEVADWVLGEKTPLTAEAIKIARDSLPEEFEDLDDATLQHMLEKFLPERRQARNIDELVYELIDTGLLISNQENGELLTISVHSLVREFCRDQQKIEIWRARLRDAAAFYTNQAELYSEYDKSEADIWDEIEAFELLIEAEDYASGAFLLNNVFSALVHWGYGRYLESHLYRLLGKLDQLGIATIRHNLGMLLQGRGEYDAALKQHKLSLELSKKSGDRARMAASFHHIGIIYQDRGNYDDALQYFRRSIKILEDLGDQAHIAAVSHQIGLIHEVRGKYDAALQAHQLSLKISKDQDNRPQAALSYRAIGSVLHTSGELDTAIQHYELSVKIEEELGNLAGMASSRHEMGRIYTKVSSYEMALQQFQISLKIFEEIGEQHGVAASLHHIGIIFQILGNYDTALLYYQRSLKISESLGDRRGVAQSFHQIGMIYQALGDYDTALQQYQFSVGISEELGDRLGVASSSCNIGMVYQTCGNFDAAIKQYQFSLKEFKELGSYLNMADSYLRIATIHQHRGNYDAAIKQYQFSLKIFEELGERSGTAYLFAQIGSLYTEIGRYTESLRYLLYALSTFIEMQSAEIEVVVGYLKTLRSKLGEQDFNTAWQEVTDEEIPDWLK